jgi:Contractile injection system tube protein
MGLFDKAKLEKMTLRAFKPAASPDDPPKPSDAPEDCYTVQVNPSSYTLNRLVNYSYLRGQGFSASEAVYSDSPPVHLEFEFLFDGTGVIPKPAPLGDIPLVGAIASALSPDTPFVVMDEIAKFNKLVGYDGKVHRPRQLLLVWGSLAFSCVVTSVDYRFTLFKEDGTPLRAVAKCTFCESIPGAERVRRDNASSPDLTHLRDVQDGDTLPLLAYDVYGNAQLYLEVARVNKLIDFRRLRSGTRLSFPPVDRQVTAS